MPKLSQVFLTNKSIAKRMSKYANIKKTDVVLEIGPGKGIITQELLKRAKRVIAVEKDNYLADQLSAPNLKVINSDILTTKLPKFDKIVANIPFQISSPLTFLLFKQSWKSAVLIYQKEFAERFFSKPGSKKYSRLTIAINYYSEPEILEKVPRTQFYPKPKVDALMVKLTPKKPEFETTPKFWEFVNKIFQHKKKTIRAALISAKFPKSKVDNLPESIRKNRVVSCSIYDLREIYTNI